MHRLRPVAEAEVIGEFLRSEFYEGEFEPYRDRFEYLVRSPDFTSEAENSIRRALLFRRRGYVWRELPRDTRWWEVSIESHDICNMQVFTRGHWVKLKPHQRSLLAFSRLVTREALPGITDAHLRKLSSVRSRLQQSSERSSILLLGMAEEQPTTILEGNNRMTAALSISETAVFDSFRFYAGISSQMHRCIFYESNWFTLARYLYHKVKIAVLGDRTSELLAAPTAASVHKAIVPVDNLQ